MLPVTAQTLQPIEPRLLGQVDYMATFEAMKQFTQTRDPQTPDSLWICEHPSVYTQGLAGKADHVLSPGNIPVVQSNRGGQVTFHGPGQVVAYPLIDLQRAGYYVKEYVYRIEESVIKTLAYFGVTGHRVAGSPGIYVRLDDPTSHAALSGPRHPADPFRGRHWLHGVGHDENGGRHAIGHRMIAHRDAPRDLDINQLVWRGGCAGFACKVRYQLLGNLTPLSMRQGIGDAQLTQAPVQSRHVLGKAKGLSCIHRYNFINAIAKNEASIQYADLGVAQGRVGAVEVAQGGGQVRAGNGGWVQ